MRLENNPALLRQLNRVELEAWELLSDKPIELDVIVDENRAYARALAKLKRLGLAIYSGFTPTDAVHVLGINSHWSTRAAELSARIWMRQMRFLYGYGKWDGDDIETACREVYELVNANIRRLLIEVGLNEFDLAGKSGKSAAIVETITRMALGSHQNKGRKPLFNLDFASDYPIVAVGAPAASYYREVADSMTIGLHLPEHADVANAFGAVMGSVIQRAQVTVTQPQHGIFCLFHEDQPQNFDDLDAARQAAREIVFRLAQQRALEAGAIEPTVTIDYEDLHVKDKIDGELFLESTVIATAIGRACDWRADIQA